MDLRLLETFVTVARTGSVSAASRDLYLSQSAVSRQVQRFERQMGVELFSRRGGRAVELTEAGQRVLALGDELLGRTERLEEELRGMGLVRGAWTSRQGSCAVACFIHRWTNQPVLETGPAATAQREQKKGNPK